MTNHGRKAKKKGDLDRDAKPKTFERISRHPKAAVTLNSMKKKNSETEHVE